MAALDLEALSKLEAEATEGPWVWSDVGEKCNSWVLGTAVDDGDNRLAGHLDRDDGTPVDYVCEAGSSGNFQDAEFLVALRNAAPALLEKAKRLDELESALEWLSCCIDDWTIQNESTTAEKSFHAVNDEVTKWHDAPTVAGAVCGLAKQYGWSPKGQGK